MISCMWIYNPWIDKTLHWMDIGFIYYISYASSYCIEEHSHNKFCHNFGQKLFFQNYLFHQYILNCGSLTASTINPSGGTWSQCSSIIWRHYATKYWYYQFLSLFPQKNKILISNKFMFYWAYKFLPWHWDLLLRFSSCSCNNLKAICHLTIR